MLKTPDGTFHLNLDKRLVGYNEEIVDMNFLVVEEQFLVVATSVEQVRLLFFDLDTFIDHKCWIWFMNLCCNHVVYFQVRVYDLSSMSCSYVLSGHTDIVLCLDTCTTTSGRTLIVTGNKDNIVSSLFVVKNLQCKKYFVYYKIWISLNPKLTGKIMGLTADHHGCERRRRWKGGACNFKNARHQGDDSENAL